MLLFGNSFSFYSGHSVFVDTKACCFKKKIFFFFSRFFYHFCFTFGPFPSQLWILLVVFLHFLSFVVVCHLFWVQGYFSSSASAHSSLYGDFVFASTQLFRAFRAVSGPVLTSHGFRLLLCREYCRSSHRASGWPGLDPSVGAVWVLQFPRILGFKEHSPREWSEAAQMSCLPWAMALAPCLV